MKLKYCLDWSRNRVKKHACVDPDDLDVKRKSSALITGKTTPERTWCRTPDVAFVKIVHLPPLPRYSVSAD